MTLQRLSSALCSFFLAAAAAGQVPQIQASPGSPGDPFSIDCESYGVCVTDGRIRAEGSRYMAVFDRGGIEFTPALGAAAPHDMPLRLTLESIRRGETVIHRVDRVPAGEAGVGEGGARFSVRRNAVLRAGDFGIERGEAEPDGFLRVDRAAAGESGARIDEKRNLVVYDRGSITERYEAVRDGVEQSFRFAERPVGRGDLVVRLRVETALSPVAATDLDSKPETMQFEAHGIGGVSIGAVTGISADGRQAEGHMRYRDGFLELVLPDAFVSSAIYPMVLDPLIGSVFSAQNSNNEDSAPDVAFDEATQRYLVVWNRTFSSSNRQIRGRLVDQSGQRLLPSFIEITSSGNSARPAVCSLAASRGFVAVWQQFGSTSDIQGRLVARDATLGPITDIRSTRRTESHPDVSGDPTGQSNRVVVTYKFSDDGIFAHVLEYDSRFGRGSTVRVVGVGGTSRATNPRISKTGGTNRRSCVVWEEPGTRRVLARSLSLDGANLSPVINVAGFSAGAARPAVDGDGTTFLVAYSDRVPSSPTALGVRGVTLTELGGGSLAVLNRGTIFEDLNSASINPTVAVLGGSPLQWATAWQGGVNGQDVLIRNVGLDANACGPVAEVRSSDGLITPKMASRTRGGAADGRAFVAFERVRDSAGDSIFATFYEGAVGGQVRDVASGCSGGGQLSIDGAFAHGRQVDIALSGADQAATLCLFSVGFEGRRTQVPCGPCPLLLGPIRVVVPITAGSASVSGLEVPCDAGLNGVDIDFQFLVGAVNGSGCTIPVATSNLVRATIDS